MKAKKALRLTIETRRRIALTAIKAAIAEGKSHVTLKPFHAETLRYLHSLGYKHCVWPTDNTAAHISWDS